MTVTHTPGQPLHIKVTPDHMLNTATLEISSPTGDTATSYTSTAVIPTGGASPKQRITIIQNSALSAVNTKTPPSSPDCIVSSLNGTPISQVLGPNSKSSSTDINPSIITTEDNKIHIHLGSPYIQSLNGRTHSIPPPVGPYHLRHEQKNSSAGQ